MRGKVKIFYKAKGDVTAEIEVRRYKSAEDYLAILSAAREKAAKNNWTIKTGPAF